MDIYYYVDFFIFKECREIWKDEKEIKKKDFDFFIYYFFLGGGKN